MLAFDLPKEVLIHLLVEWLDVNCCRALDTSLCCRAYRPGLLQVLSDATFMWHQLRCGILNDNRILQWVWKRNVGIEAMVIPSGGRNFTLDFSVLTDYLKKKGTSLTYLSMFQYDEESYGFFEKLPIYLNSSELKEVLSCCPNLTALENLCSDSVSLVSMGTLRRNCRALRKLSIQHHKSDSWDPTPLIALVAGGDCGLTHLRLPAAERFMNKFATIVKNLPQLRSLHFSRSRDIFNCEPDDKAFIAIAENCTFIESLYLSNLRHVSDSSLFALSHGSANLQSLYLARSKDITPAGLICLVRNCQELTVLDLSECIGVNDAALVNIAANCANLTEMKFTHAPLVTDASLHALAEHCPMLRTIDFSHCQRITSEGVSALAQGCAKMTSIGMSSCFAVDNDCIDAIARHCVALSYVGLLNNGWLTETAVRKLVDNCPRLCEKGLALNGCMQLSREFRHNLQDKGLYAYAEC